VQNIRRAALLFLLALVSLWWGVQHAPAMRSTALLPEPELRIRVQSRHLVIEARVRKLWDWREQVRSQSGRGDADLPGFQAAAMALLVYYHSFSLYDAGHHEPAGKSMMATAREAAHELREALRLFETSGFAYGRTAEARAQFLGVADQLDALAEDLSARIPLYVPPEPESDQPPAR